MFSLACISCYSSSTDVLINCFNSSDRFTDLSSNSIDAMLKVNQQHNTDISAGRFFFYHS